MSSLLVLQEAGPKFFCSPSESRTKVLLLSLGWWAKLCSTVQGYFHVKSLPVLQEAGPKFFCSPFLFVA